MHYTIYKITNKINGKYYIGKHKTENPMDAYYGSGLAINSAIKEYGKENFIKEILFDCNSESEMNSLEREIVNESLVKDASCYNMSLGGEGGNGGFTGKTHSAETMKKIWDSIRSDPDSLKKVLDTLKACSRANGLASKGRVYSGKGLDNLREGAKKRSGNRHFMKRDPSKIRKWSVEEKLKASMSRKGNVCSEETKQKIRDKARSRRESRDKSNTV